MELSLFVSHHPIRMGVLCGHVEFETLKEDQMLFVLNPLVTCASLTVEVSV